MTEKDVKRMEAEIDQTSIDPEFERTWLDEQHAALRSQEKRVVMVWKFQKLMRNDEQMKAAYDDLVKIREGIVIVKDRLCAIAPACPSA